MMTTNSIRVLAELRKRFGDRTTFKRGELHHAAEAIGVDDYSELIADQYRIKRGFYDLSPAIRQSATAPGAAMTAASVAAAVAPAEEPIKIAPLKLAAQISSTMDDHCFVPSKDSTYVRWGHYSDIHEIITSKLFFPVFIAGLSGNGKSMMVEQACAALGREYIRVQIAPETDEDDLIGGFRLIDGETVFAKGPVIKAMERGAVLCLDEVDRGTNKLLCLQGVLEGKPILIKKTGEVIHPAPGFTVIATANTKGKGSEDGRFNAATIIDEAFLERFSATYEQPYPSLSVEKKIVRNHFEKFGKANAETNDFTDKLGLWAEVIRKTFADGGVSEIISTRRLCHIAQTHCIFNNRLKSIDLCISRFDDDTKNAFRELYSKIDVSVSTAAPVQDEPTTVKASKEVPF